MEVTTTDNTTLIIIIIALLVGFASIFSGADIISF